MIDSKDVKIVDLQDVQVGDWAMMELDIFCTTVFGTGKFFRKTFEMPVRVSKVTPKRFQVGHYAYVKDSGKLFGSHAYNAPSLVDYGIPNVFNHVAWYYSAISKVIVNRLNTTKGIPEKLDFGDTFINREVYQAQIHARHCEAIGRVVSVTSGDRDRKTPKDLLSFLSKDPVELVARRCVTFLKAYDEIQN